MEAGGGVEAEGGAADATLSAELITSALGEEFASASAAATAGVDEGEDEEVSAALQLRNGAALGARFGSQTAMGCGCCSCSCSASGVAAAAAWFAASTSLFAIAWVIANGLPFFAELTGILGAISHTPIGLLFPSLFTLAVAHGAGRTKVVESPRPLGCPQYALCVLLVLFSTVLMCVGFVANVRSAVLKAGDEGLPFACHCRAEECAVPQP